MKKLQIVLIVFLLITIGLVGAVAYVTHGFSDWNTGSSEDSRTPEKETDVGLYVNGNKIKSSDDIPSVSSVYIEVRNVELFDVEIVPGNVGFDFTHDDALVMFPYIDMEFNGAFGVEKTNGGFTLRGNAKSLTEILSQAYPGEVINIVGDISKTAAYFVLRVSTAKSVMNIPLTGFYKYMRVELDVSEIVF